MANVKTLKKWAKKLNSYGLADEINLDQDLEDLQEDFISTVEELDDEDKTEGIDDKLLDFYESLLDEGPEEPEEEEEEEEEEEPEPKKKRKTSTRKSKPKATKKAEPEEEEEDEPEEEEEDEPEEEEPEEDEGDEYDEMDRSELVKVAKGLGIKCLKSMTEDDYREAIRSNSKPKTAAKTTAKKGKGKRPANFQPSGKVPITDAAAMAIKAQKGKSTTVRDLARETNRIRVDGGGKDNVSTCGYYVKFVLKVMTELGYATTDGKKVKFS